MRSVFDLFVELGRMARAMGLPEPVARVAVVGGMFLLVIGVCLVPGLLLKRYLDQRGAGVKARLMIAAPLLLWALYDWRDEAASNPLTLGDEVVATLPAEQREEVERRYLELMAAFRAREYAKVIAEADELQKLVPGGYHFSAQYRLDAVHKSGVGRQVAGQGN